MQPRLNTLR